MEIGSVNRVDTVAPASPSPATQDDASNLRQIVTAIRSLNKSELMPPDRELTFMLDPQTRRPLIQIIERDTGTVISQIPPEVILRMEQQERDSRKEE